MNFAVKLINKTAEFSLSDPWTLGETIGWQPIKIIVVKHGIRPQSSYGKESESILIKVVHPFVFEGTKYEYLVASPRHEGDSFGTLGQGENVFCSLIRVTEEQAMSNKPFDLSWWRGGGALIGTVILDGRAGVGPS